MYFWWLTALAPYLCKAQNVYSVNVYAGGVVYEKQWLIGSPPSQWGLSQYSRWEDPNGLVIINAGHEKERGGIQHRYTKVHLGAASFSVRLPAPAVAFIIALLAIMSIGVLGSALKKRIWHTKHQDVT